jgi:hypothetical protein
VANFQRNKISPCVHEGPGRKAPGPFFVYTKELRTRFLLGAFGLLAALSALAADPLTTTPKPALKQVPTARLAQPKQIALKSTYLKPGASRPAPAATARPLARKAPVRPSYYGQMQPSSDRYKEIQQALSDKGYFSGSPDGVWGASSTDALKRFQHDQNLSEDGKVDALSLIALGLGPKRTLVAADPPATK